MKSSVLLAAIAVLAAVAGSPSPAGARDARKDHGMRAVPNAAGPGQPGDGWRYFSDPAAHRAVAISPQGEYYFSRGKGLDLVATPARSLGYLRAAPSGIRPWGGPAGS